MAVDAMAAISQKVDTMAAVSYHIINTYLYVHNLWNALEWYSSMLCYTGSYDYHFESRHKAPCILQVLLWLNRCMICGI